MTDDTKPTTRQAIAAQNRSGKLTVSGKLKVALDDMLYRGSCRTDAATAAGMTDHGLREALKKPHVKAYYNAGLEVIRTSERVRNISALVEVRDDAGNAMARVAAVKALEQLTEAEANNRATGIPTQPGLIIVIEQPKQPIEHRPIVDVTPDRLDS